MSAKKNNQTPPQNAPAKAYTAFWGDPWRVMKTKFRIDTPDGAFPVFSSEIRPDLYVATVVYYGKRMNNGNEKEAPRILKADIYMEKGITEAQALERLKAWCVTMFGEPCAISKEE